MTEDAKMYATEVFDKTLVGQIVNRENTIRAIALAFDAGKLLGSKSVPAESHMPMRFAMALQAVDSQANDETLWMDIPSASEAYIKQSLRWLHSVIEEGDTEAYNAILRQSVGDI